VPVKDILQGDLHDFPIGFTDPVLDPLAKSRKM
jgi:hypothetical protein